MIRRPLLPAALLALCCHAAPAAITVTGDKPAGLYTVGDTIHWTVTPDPAGSATLPYQIKRNGLTVVQKGDVDLSKGPQQIQIPADHPGAMLLELGAGRTRLLAGALIDPEKLGPTLPPPDDFQQFWTGKIADLHKIPMNPQLQPADSGHPDIAYFKLQMDGYANSHIYGQLAEPRAPGKHPALLQLQWAGVYGLPASNVVTRAQQGWLALNIEPHDLPFDQPPAFYQAASEGAQKDYYHQGNNDRDKSYFLRMYLSCYRAVDYLASRDDWDGKTLVVMGTSMGGQQTLITAGLHPAVTAMLALVPSSCDAAGPTAQGDAARAAGFPDWAAQAKQNNDPQIIETSRYFDPENFARQIKCPALVGLGLIDETCPPAGVYAAFNLIPSKKQVVVLPHSDHQGHNNTQADYNHRAEEWLTALQKNTTP